MLDVVTAVPGTVFLVAAQICRLCVKSNVLRRTTFALFNTFINKSALCHAGAAGSAAVSQLQGFRFDPELSLDLILNI